MTVRHEMEFNNGGKPFLPTRQLLGREADTFEQPSGIDADGIQIEEAKERFKDVSGKFSRICFEISSENPRVYRRLHAREKSGYDVHETDFASSEMSRAFS